jgi:hypothetical protein
MRNLFAFLILTVFTFISCERNDSIDPVDYYPKVTEITYITPPNMQIIYSNEKIVKIEWFINENLYSVIEFF